MGSIATTLLSFLILVICLFSHFFLASLAVGLPILWIILKNQLLTLLFFSHLFSSLSPPSLPPSLPPFLPFPSFPSFPLDFMYLFMRDTERVRGRDIGRERSRLHAGSWMWDWIPGIQDHAPNRWANWASSFLSFPFFFPFSFPFLWEREREWAEEKERKRERESQADSPAEYRAWLRAQSYDPEIMTWAKSKIQMLIRLSHLAMFACFNSTDFYFILPFLLLALLVLVS